MTAEHLDEALRQQLSHWRTSLGSGAVRVGWKICLLYTSPSPRD